MLSFLEIGAQPDCLPEIYVLDSVLGKLSIPMEKDADALGQLVGDRDLARAQ
jgi:hypothetical protein